MVNEKEYCITYDIMNIAACIAVIVLHVNGIFWTFSYERYWKTSLIIETAFYWAVPVFFMLTGATLIDYRDRYSTATFFRKRFTRTVAPFIIWSIISVIWAVYFVHYLQPEDISTWQKWINAILNCKGMSIYWFFPPLFAVYLSIPVLSYIPKDDRKKVYGYLIAYGMLSCAILPNVCAQFGVYINGDLRSPLNGGGYLIYPLIGYWITRYPVSRKTRVGIYVLGFAGWLLRLAYTWKTSLAQGSINQTMFGYTNYPGAFLGVSVFVWFWYRDWSPLSTPKTIPIIRKLSSASLGIFLVHFYIMRAIVDYFQIPMQSIVWRIAGVPLIYGVSLCIVLIAKEIPVVKKMFP